MNPQELGHWVFKRRKDQGLSQEALAQEASISRNYVSLIERGEARNVSLSILNRLALALRTTPIELLGLSDHESTLIPPELRELGLVEGLSFVIVDKLVRIPQRGREPRTMAEWRQLYQAIRPYLVEPDGAEN